MRETFTPEEIAVLSPYVSNTNLPVFTVGNLPEEVVAVLFAYYSRSKESLRRNLLKLINERDVEISTRGSAVGPIETAASLAAAREKAKQFHEKWVVGYGHASVAEHAIAHIAIEDVSIVASKIIEDNRLASYTEKSTRYVVFDPEKYYKAPELTGSSSENLYRRTVSSLMSAYAELTPKAIDKIKLLLPRGEKQSEIAYNAACRAKACDVLRYILPAATFTNIGLTINARALEHMITKLLSNPLAEAQRLGNMIKAEAEKIIPTLLKYADHNGYIAETNSVMSRIASEALTAPSAIENASENDVSLIRFESDVEDQLVASILYGYTQTAAAELMVAVRSMTADQKERVIDEYLSRRGKWDEPLRALEHIYYTFEVLVDYGAFRDIQRHRMATQTTQLFTDVHGYETPPEIIEYGYKTLFNELMERARSAYQTISGEFPREAQYVLPLAYRQRVLFTWNLREIHHFVSLRSAKQGHASYRSIAQQVYRELERVHPLLAKYIRVDLADYALARI